MDFDLSHLIIENPKKIIQGEPINFDVNYQNHNNNVSSLEKVKKFLRNFENEIKNNKIILFP